MVRQFAILAAAVTLASCSSSADISAAQAGVKTFHSQLDAGQFAAIYQAADPRFRQAAPSADFEKMLGAIRRKLGTTVSTRQTGFRVNYHTAGNTVELAQQTRFQRGEGAESFVFALSGGKVALLGYNIQSQALIVN